MMASPAILEATSHNEDFKAYTQNAAAHTSHRPDEIPNTELPSYTQRILKHEVRIHKIQQDGQCT